MTMIKCSCRVGAWILLALASAASAEGPRNVVLIMADDIGRECFGCYGSEQYQTPCIDRLAATGARFTNCFSQPLCTPSRVKIMTGVSNVRNYVGFCYMDPSLDTIGNLMQRSGRRTLCVGKWQLQGFNSIGAVRRLGEGLLPGQAGFDEYCLWQITKRPKRYWDGLLETDRGDLAVGPDGYGPDACVDTICEFVEKNAGEPFFVYYPMMLVHDPFLTTPDSENRDSTDEQANFEDMVAYMDKLVGRIVDCLDRQGLRDDTLVIFTGDNGTHRKIHSKLRDRTIRGGKGQTTDAGTRVPLIANWPGVTPAGVVDESLVDFADFKPTLAELVGADPGPETDGISFAPQLRGEAAAQREWVYCYYWSRPERANQPPKRYARDAHWKLYGNGDYFNTTRDPLEKRPLEAAKLGSRGRAAHEKLTAALASMPSEGQAIVLPD